MGRRAIPTLSYGDKFYWEILTKSGKGGSTHGSANAVQILK